MKNVRKNGGFSTIELIVVMAVDARRRGKHWLSVRLCARGERLHNSTRFQDPGDQAAGGGNDYHEGRHDFVFATRHSERK